MEGIAVFDRPLFENIDTATADMDQTSNDLETGTTQITAVAEASGVGNADYSKALTIPLNVSDARIQCKRIASRLVTIIDSMGSATELNVRVYVDAQDADHLLFDLTGAAKYTGTGTKTEVVDVHSSNKATIFNLLKDGAEHIFYFFFWADNATGPTISAVQLWESVGTYDSASFREVLRIPVQGLVTIQGWINRVGSGTNIMRVTADNIPWASGGARHILNKTGVTEFQCEAFVVASDISFWCKGSVGTDLNTLARAQISVMR